VIVGGGENFEDFDFSISPVFAGSATATSLIGSKIALRVKWFWIVGNHVFVEASGCKKQPLASWQRNGRQREKLKHRI